MVFNLHFLDYCNFKCKYCFIKKEQKELSIENIKLIIDKIANFSIKRNERNRINLAGGEPLVSNHIQDIIDYIHEKNLDVSLITNGSLLTEDFIIHNKDKLSMIGISVDSFNDSTNIDIGRCCGSKVLGKDRIIALASLIKKTNIKLKINVCCSTKNIYENNYSTLKRINPDRIKFLRVMCDHDKTLKKYDLTNQEWDFIKNKYRDIPNSVFEDNDDMKRNYIIIDSSGNVSRDNLHIINNSLLDKELVDCLNEIGIEVEL